MQIELNKPSRLLYFTESLRSFIETIKGFLFLLFTQRTNEGKGRVVMVIPGLLASDFWTFVLRSFLKKKGFIVYGWELGTNLGNIEKLPLLSEKIQSVSQSHNQKVILIGWSMGGLFNRTVCHQLPDYISRVITMGSPFADIHAPNHAQWVYELLNDEKDVDQKLISTLHLPTPMPSTAIYSKKDGIVPWQACMDKNADKDHKNVEVKSSHFGMGANPEVLNAVLNSLVA
jgi:pimeloyl-ACP methyl ester carboxylesterase